MTNCALSNPNSQPDSREVMELKIVQERLRQAQQSFNLALLMTTVCTIIGATGVGLLLAGRVPEGAVATTGGMYPIIPCVKLAREANDRLDKLRKELTDED